MGGYGPLLRVSQRRNAPLIDRGVSSARPPFAPTPHYLENISMTPPASNFQPPASSSSIQPPASSITLSSAQFTTSNRANWLLAIVSSVIAVGIAELTLRVAPIPAIQRVRMQQAVSRPEEEVHPRGLYTLHPQIGWTLTPGFSGRFRKADFDISVQASR